jgi:hypothetical protein
MPVHVLYKDPPKDEGDTANPPEAASESQ